MVKRARRRPAADAELVAVARVVEEATADGLARARHEWTDDERETWGPVVSSFLLDAHNRGEAGLRSLNPAAVTAAFVSLYQPVPDPAPEPPTVVREAIVDQFHRLYYHRAPRTWRNTWYRGHRILKLPLDLWVYAELIHKLRPALVVETGTRFGGSALFLADQLDLAGRGRVVTVDIDEMEGRPVHDRITYVSGSSTDPAVVGQVASYIGTGDDAGPVMVILDSDHSRDHVRDELAALSPLVTVGSYLIVEDTNINGHPVLPEFGPGPWEALQEFLEGTEDFEVDAGAEKFFVTMNPSGYLLRVR